MHYTVSMYCIGMTHKNPEVKGQMILYDTSLNGSHMLTAALIDFNSIICVCRSYIWPNNQTNIESCFMQQIRIVSEKEAN